MNKSLLPIFSLVALFILVSAAHAQTPSTSVSIAPLVAPSGTTGANVQSDYAKDVTDGEKGTANDVEAQNNQKDVADNENVEAQEETEAAEPVEAIEPAEAEEPQEALENESEGEKSGGESSPEGSEQESRSSSEGNKQLDGEQ